MTRSAATGEQLEKRCGYGAAISIDRHTAQCFTGIQIVGEACVQLFVYGLAASACRRISLSHLLELAQGKEQS